jgi:hypothetical protein
VPGSLVGGGSVFSNGFPHTNSEPGTLLGSAHPLTRVSRATTAVARQACVATLLLAAALAATADGVAWAPAADAGAALTLAALGALAIALRARARWEARELIARGDEHLPLPPVERERRRLLSERTRRSVAASLERIVDLAAEPLPRFAPPLFDVRVVRAVAGDLRRTAEVLRSGTASARGVALAERLVTWGGSELHGHELGPLREELRRVRYLLADVSARGSGWSDR